MHILTAELAKILYIEDDPDIQMIAQIALEAIGGFTTRLCASGQEALAIADTDFMPDLILLDVMMPDMDGPMTLTQLRKIPKMANIPVIFMTAKAQTGEVNYYTSLGALGVITKPFDPVTLVDEIRRLWSGA